MTPLHAEALVFFGTTVVRRQFRGYRNEKGVAPELQVETLGDAMAGDPTLFARKDYVEEARRIVDLRLKPHTPVIEYGPNSWGPGVVYQKVSSVGGWQNPIVQG